MLFLYKNYFYYSVQEWSGQASFSTVFWPPSQNVDFLLLSVYLGSFGHNLSPLPGSAFVLSAFQNQFCLKRQWRSIALKVSWLRTPKSRMKNRGVGSFFRRHFNSAEAKRNVPSAVKGPDAHKINVSQW